MSSAPIKSASHRVTNDVLYGLITERITPESRVLDFGAGRGHMAQRLGNFFQQHGQSIPERLTACEITPEYFEYSGTPCKEIGVNSEIPVAAASQNLIYAIEVLEHVPRPYDFFHEAFAKLKPGGWVVFSVPNSLHFKSRLQFLFTGYADMFGPPSVEDKNAGRICGHIMPLSYSYFVYGLKRAGFTGMEFHQDRSKRLPFALAVLFYPVLWLGSRLADRSLKKYDRELWEQNRPLIWRVNRLDVLSSRSCIVIAQKPK